MPATMNLAWSSTSACNSRRLHTETLLGADSETALRWFVLVVALLDPAAVPIAGSGVGTA
jgi:hypothetical protein